MNEGKIVDYDIIAATHSTELVRAVTQRLTSGWQPFGVPWTEKQGSVLVIHQPMVKRETAEPETIPYIMTSDVLAWKQVADPADVRAFEARMAQPLPGVLDLDADNRGSFVVGINGQRNMLIEFTYMTLAGACSTEQLCVRSVTIRDEQ